MPNKQTVDPNSNKVLDIFRCKLVDPAAVAVYKLLSLAINADVVVEIYRSGAGARGGAGAGSVGVGALLVSRFSIPLVTRRTGYLLASPAAGSYFDAWQHVHVRAHPQPGAAVPSSPLPVPASEAEAESDAAHTGALPPTRVVMCVPGLRREVSRESLPQYLEFIEHHLGVGVGHIFLSIGA